MGAAQEPARQRRSDARRNVESIVDSAATLLARDPRASMRDIAEAAGVHRATVHRHFPGRDDLVRAVRERALDELVAVLEDPELERLSGGEALERVTTGALLISDRYRLHRVSATIDEATDARGRRIVRALGRVLERGAHEGAVRGDLPTARLAAAWGGLIFIAGVQIEAGDATLDESADLVLTLLRPPAR